MSPKLFADQFSKSGRLDLEYLAYDLPEISDFKTFTANNPDIVALNVTIPHKESILPYLSEIDEEAQAIGAVNTLFKAEGKWKGYNTDGWGFRRSMQPFLRGRHERALIFGTGGAAKAVAYSLKLLGVACYFVSRTPDKKRDISNVIGFDELTPEAIKHHLLLINCTPLGMDPDTNGCVKIPWQGVGKRSFSSGSRLQSRCYYIYEQGVRERCGGDERTRHVETTGREIMGYLVKEWIIKNNE